MTGRFLTASSIVLLVVGCGGESFEIAPPPDASTDSSTDSTSDVPPPDSKPAVDADAQDVPVVPDPCKGKPDGTVCSTLVPGIICVAGVCVTSRCGDKFVDKARGEDCEDGNDVAGDGCTNCRFDCKSATECDDKNVCNGVETCDTVKHVCTIGAAPVKGTPCSLESGGEGICNGPTCAKAGCGDGVKSGSEECDDGNVVSGDGCEPDCKFSCNKDSDCNDSDVCNGVETCDVTKHACVLGTPLKCDDGKACTVDTCDPVSGCKNQPIDKDGDGKSCEDDCDDSDPNTYVGAPELCDGKDNNCNKTVDEPPVVKTTCWADGDKDGFAPKDATSMEACSCGEGWTGTNPSIAFDCQDKIASVNSKQTEFFTLAYCASVGADGSCTKTSFDYDCNGFEEKQNTRVFPSGGCDALGGCTSEGWVTSVPACGAGGSYSICKKATVGCTKSTSWRVQGCR